jgi:hypothetical protein
VEIILLVLQIVAFIVILGMFFVVMIVLIKIDGNLIDREYRDKKLVHESLKLANKIIDKIREE